MTDVAQSVRRASDSDAVNWGARLGLGARGVIYLLMGLLALSVALGKSSSEADQRGALQEVAHHSGGAVLLVVLAVGFAAYALWRLSEAAFGVTGDGKGASPRVKAAASAVIYAFLAVTTVSVLMADSGSSGSSGSTGSKTSGSKSQAAQQQDVTAKVMDHTGGRWLVGLVGVVVVVVGAAMVWDGVKEKFMKYLRTGQMSATTRRVVKRLGVVGTVARGVVIGLAGGLVVDAAATYSPEKARGVDGALRTLAAQPYGRVLLVLAALGLIAFGLYGLAEARWRRT